MISERVIPMLPCPDVRQQAAFYEMLGFEIKGMYTSPNPYAVVQYNTIELHFYGTKKVPPVANSSMCYISVKDVDTINEAFVSALKKHTGKVPRSGLPRISKVSDLQYDRRFTFTDPGGNTFYIGTPRTNEVDVFFRTLNNQEWAKKFTVLYDVLYSREDPFMAEGMLSKYAAMLGIPDQLDKAKFLLLTIDLQRQLGKPIIDSELKELVQMNSDNDEDWKKIERRYHALLSED